MGIFAGNSGNSGEGKTYQQGNSFLFDKMGFLWEAPETPVREKHTGGIRLFI
jgi:hypothetical protein